VRYFAEAFIKAAEKGKVRDLCGWVAGLYRDIYASKYRKKAVVGWQFMQE
jgi:GH25 family lysozyme M1 (1,4-beta-N-acetylmuramidase)